MSRKTQQKTLKPKNYLQWITSSRNKKNFTEATIWAAKAVTPNRNKHIVIVIYRRGVLASAARAACVAELSRCVGPWVDVATVEVSLPVTMSASRRRRRSSIDGWAYDSCARIDDVPPCVDVAPATSWVLSGFVAVSAEDFDTAVEDVPPCVVDRVMATSAVLSTFAAVLVADADRAVDDWTDVSMLSTPSTNVHVCQSYKFKRSHRQQVTTLTLLQLLQCSDTAGWASGTASGI